MFVPSHRKYKNFSQVSPNSHHTDSSREPGGGEKQFTSGNVLGTPHEAADGHGQPGWARALQRDFPTSPQIMGNGMRTSDGNFMPSPQKTGYLPPELKILRLAVGIPSAGAPLEQTLPSGAPKAHKELSLCRQQKGPLKQEG